MASPFLWTDTVQIALGSCLPCIVGQTKTSATTPEEDHRTVNRIPRARPDELQGLLADTDTEAETMSLHTNPGERNRKRTKKKKKSQGAAPARTITLFGYDLFGRAAPPPIQLPEDGQDAFYGPSEGSRRRRSDSAAGAIQTPSVMTVPSTSTFDSDAAPLDADTIAAFSSTGAAAALVEAAAQAEAVRLAEKEERRKKRKERKEMKRLAEAMAARGGSLNSLEDDAFEGFQGSGGEPVSGAAYPRMPNPSFYSHRHRGSESGSGFSGSTSARTSATPVMSPPPSTGVVAVALDDDDDEADLDGAMYSRKNRPRALGKSQGSDSRSRTSASVSERGPPLSRHQSEASGGFPPDPRNVMQHFQAQIQSEATRVAAQNGPLSPPTPKRTKKSKSSTSGSHTTRSHSSTGSISQPPSLPSPLSPSFPQNQFVSPTTVEQGLGFFDPEDFDRSGQVVTVRPESSGFPSVGLGGRSRAFSKARDIGAFLATRDGEHSTR